MKKTSRTAFSFHEGQMDDINKLKSELAGKDQKDLSSREIFMLGMAYGHASKNKITGWKRLNNGPRLEYMQRRDETLIAAVSIADFDDPKCLRDVDAMYNLAEDYAAGGIALLSTALKSERDFKAWIEAEVYSSFKHAAAMQEIPDA